MTFKPSPLTELDKAEIRYEMRQLYNDVGFNGALDCLNEMFVAAEILAEVILEDMEHK